MLTKRWTAPGTSRARRGLAAGLGLLCGATMITGAATSGAQAAGDPSGAAGTAGTWCPSPAPSYDQVGDLLAELEAESLRVSAKRGLRSQISFRQRSASGTTRSEHWHFVGDPSTGRSRWFSSSTSTDAFGFSAQEAFTEQLEDAVKHRRYRRMGLGPDTTKTWAALAGLKKPEVWLRTTTTSRKQNWPLNGHPRTYTTYANRVRTDVPNATFTCDVSAGDPFDTITVVATGPAGSRTLEVDLLSNGGVFDGTPDGFTLRGDLETDPEWSASEEPLANEKITAPSSSVSPTTFRIAVTRTLTRELRDYYVLPDARAAVTKASTKAKRVAALRALAADRNKLFVRETNQDGSLTLTSRATKVTDGVRYTVRYGDHAGKVTFTVSGKKVITSTTLPRLP